MSVALSNPLSLEHSILSPDVTVTRTDDGAISSIDTGRNLITVTPDASGYGIHFQGEDGEGFVSYRVETATDAEGAASLHITENRGGAPVRTVAYRSEDSGMSMSEIDPEGHVLRKEILEKEISGETETPYGQNIE